MREASRRLHLILRRTIIRYCSIDIETTGLDHSHCQMIEFGAVVDDLNDPKPLAELPRFHCYILRDQYAGEPYALSMHAEIFKRINARADGYDYHIPQHASVYFAGFLAEQGLVEKHKQTPITVAGKNFFKFDNRFLENDDWHDNVTFHRRYLDPASMYFDPKIDECLPDLKTCLQRAGINKEVAHTAIDDALDVIKLVRHNYKLGY